MKKYIKTSIVCLATILSCMSTSLVSAINNESYDPRDVNRDNLIDMADVITVQLYLKGNLYCPTYNQLDANQSSTVDYNDVMYISINDILYEKENNSLIKNEEIDEYIGKYNVKMIFSIYA